MNTENMNHWLKLVSGTEELTGTRTRYYIGSRFIVEATRVKQDLSDKHSWMNLCKRRGYIDKALPSCIFLDTYFTDSQGNCWGWYNIQRKNHGAQIDFDYIREATPENELELVAECIRMMEMGIQPVK